ncbi:MAG: hypothetical protein IPO92_22720 [Saprospiraceae bacterium]|nr:hypothetical protein [Saprospiraceae bacterium]
MIKKNFTLIGMISSVLLIATSSLYYPGGSQSDRKAIGYDIKHNYLCNLFNETTINGQNNASRLFAIGAMFLLCASSAIFFERFSKKIPASSSATIIKYCGFASMAAAFLVVTPYHDVMTTIASIFALIALFYITVFIFKSKLMLFKILSIISLLILYVNNYIYYSGLNGIITHHAKISFLFIAIWMLGLEYFTKSSDFGNQ